MTSVPKVNTRQAAAATAAAIAEATATASETVRLPSLDDVSDASEDTSDAATKALQALTAMLAQQHLDSIAMRTEAAAGRAAQEVASELALAQQSRAAAGPSPLFLGKANDIEAQRWLIALERWFGSAQVPSTDDRSRIAIAAASMRDSAQAWWAAETTSGRADSVTTWPLFMASVKKQFLPMDTERWAMQQRERLANATIKDVAVYTAKFAELDMLLPDETPLSRVMAYERGLPERYRVKCAERRFATLVEATSATLAAWNAVESARGGAYASLSNTEAAERSDEASGASSSLSSSLSSSSSSAVGASSSLASATDPVGDLRVQVAQLTAMMLERFGSGRGGRGGHAGAGGPGGRSRQREGQSRARVRSRTPGLDDDVVRARMRAGQCIKCGQAGHYKAECVNEVKLTN